MNTWRVAPRGYERKKAHVYREIETARGITYWKTACGKKAFTMGDAQLEPRAKDQKCCATCERNVWASRSKAA